MADLPTAHAGHPTYFTHRKWGKVVMEHEAALLFTLIAFHPLRVVRGAQRCGDQSLGFTASEQRGTMNPRQYARFHRHLANLVERAMIRADTLIQNLFTENLFAQKLVVLR